MTAQAESISVVAMMSVSLTPPTKREKSAKHIRLHYLAVIDHCVCVRARVFVVESLKSFIASLRHTTQMYLNEKRAHSIVSQYSPQPRSRVCIGTHAGRPYQHHGLAAFFFLRPIL